MNTVDVDPAALSAAADRILAEAPEGLAEAPAESPAIAGEPATVQLTLAEVQVIAASYEAGAYMLVAKASDVLVPGWRITIAERTELASSIALALAAWFPTHELPPKVVACIAVAASLIAIADVRRDPTTGKLPGRSLPLNVSPTATAPDVAPAAA
jgi:hypothetical protein